MYQTMIETLYLLLKTLLILSEIDTTNKRVSNLQSLQKNDGCIISKEFAFKVPNVTHYGIYFQICLTKIEKNKLWLGFWNLRKTYPEV